MQVLPGVCDTVTSPAVMHVHLIPTLEIRIVGNLAVYAAIMQNCAAADVQVMYIGTFCMYEY